MTTFKSNNEVENYLKENMGKNLSLRRIGTDLKMKRRKVIYLVHHSKSIENVDPLDVGSKKFFIHVYRFKPT